MSLSLLFNPGVLANDPPVITTALTESTSRLINQRPTLVVSFMSSTAFFNDLKCLFSTLPLPEAISWTVPQMYDQQSTTIYYAVVRWLPSSLRVVCTYRANILFFCVILICLSLYEHRSTPLSTIWSFPRHFLLFGMSTALISSSVCKKLSALTITLLSTCNTTIADSRLLRVWNKWNGSTCSCTMLSVLIRWCKYISYQCRPHSSMPYKRLNTLSTSLDDKFMTFGGQI